MRNAYRYLAYLICGLVMLQAAVAVWSIAGMEKYLQDGGTIDFQSESLPDFPEATGFMIHGMNGMMVIPLVALILLGVAFAAKIPGGVMFAGVIVALVALQIALGLMGHSVAFMGLLHGINALILFGTALVAGRRAGAAATEPAARRHAAVPAA
ncbi:hypothetical protein [Kribbia dieselivorans]|uniref:hypothetical protein n=1 Tax=Kribbia dieselivorans TaxID=331526 RepID=UPI000837CB4F|nr:hypothetical protein [Kribbia dieselivorans]